MVKKFRVGLALQPLATALFANSPFTEGKPNGCLSLPQPYLVGHRPAPHRHAALRVRGRLRLRTLCRLHARRADVFRLPRRQVHRRRRARASAISSTGELPALPGEMPTAERLDRPSLDRLPRSAAQELPRDARRRRRARGTGSARCRPSGSGCSTTRPRSMPPGTWSSTGRWTSARRCATRCRSSALDAPIARRRQAARPRARGARHRARRASPRAPGSTRAATTKPAILEPLRRDRRQRQGPGAAPARQVSRRVGRRHQPGLRRDELLSRRRSSPPVCGIWESAKPLTGGREFRGCAA